MLSRIDNQKGGRQAKIPSQRPALWVEVIILARVVEYFLANAKSICLPGMRAIRTPVKKDKPVSHSDSAKELKDSGYPLRYFRNDDSELGLCCEPNKALARQVFYRQNLNA